MPASSTLVQIRDLICSCGHTTQYDGFDDGLLYSKFAERQGILLSWSLGMMWWDKFSRGFEAYRRFWANYVRALLVSGCVSAEEMTSLTIERDRLRFQAMCAELLVRLRPSFQSLGSCPPDCKHSRVVCDGIALKVKSKYYN